MSRAPRAPPGRRPGGIRGPQSALTDYLAANNINANQIRINADHRRQAAIASQQAAQAAQGSGTANAGQSSASATPEVAAAAAAAAAPTEVQTTLSKKRKLAENKAIAKIKASKKFQGRKAQHGSDSEMDDDELARQMYDEDLEAALPAQEDDCEVCGKHFRVTPYSAEGPDGGFLCPKCTKDFEDSRPKKKRATQGRKARSNALDMVTSRGTKSLVTLCVETLAKNVDMADDLGDLPEELIDRVSALLSKNRLIDPSNVGLFMQATSDTVTIYDCAKLQSDDFIRIFQLVPLLKNLRMRNCIQFKNKVMDYLIECPIQLENFSIAGANLIDDERWAAFIIMKGSHLRSLKVYHTDNHFGDEHLELLKTHCPDLVRLKVTHNQKITSKGLSHIAGLQKLQHLTLEIYQYTETEPYVEIINAIGANLRTLCLRKIEYLEDTVLEAIHKNCTNLRKLHLVDNETFTDKAFEALFTDWSNTALVNVDFKKCRHIESSVPMDNPDGIGFCSGGFVALMKHSGRALRHINVCADRHISREAFESVFSPSDRYEKLETLDLSFCWGINDDVIGAIFRCAHSGSLKAIKTFGNFGVSGVWDKGAIPSGVFLIGMPTGAGMHIEGEGKKLLWGYGD